MVGDGQVGQDGQLPGGVSLPRGSEGYARNREEINTLHVAYFSY